VSSAPLEATASQPLAGGPSFSFANRLERLAFRIAWLLLARWTPVSLRAWRRAVLRAFGASIGRGCYIYPNVTIWLPRHLIMGDFATLGPGVDCYNMAPITIGARAIVSQRAFLCAGDHDPRDPLFQLVASPITIGAGSWIAAEAFVGPGVTIGEGAVLAARGCAARDVAPWTIAAGNPACEVARRELRREPA
jgi:putative colanic acid biosynthesis acetyltransferase WcaF